jgi:signal peptidase I
MLDKFKQEIISWLKLIVLAVVIVVLLHQFGFNLTIVKGQSMSPTLHDGERLLVNRAVFLWDEPKISDIVILKEPGFTGFADPYLVKRVVAVAGDLVEIRGGALYRNGQKVPEKYTDVQIEDGDYGPDTVAVGNVFVMGDNRTMGSSKDSRYFGQVPIDLVYGRAEFRLWPLEQAGELQ